MSNVEEDLAVRQVIMPGANDTALAGPQQEKLLVKLSGWEINHCGKQPFLCKIFRFSNFDLALQFVNRVAELAEKENHHPEIILNWGRVEVRWWTHSLNGLHINDFILAARTDSLFD